MSFERKGTPEPIKTCQYILDDAQNVTCVCGEKVGTVSHGVIKTFGGIAVLSSRGIRCPKCGGEIEFKEVVEE
jgi:DNA-directed RNA polymerase subunit RPC12/RpoP